MNRYEITVTFTADRPLTEDERGTLAERIALEVEDPQTRDDDGMPTDAGYRTAYVEVCWGA